MKLPERYHGHEQAYVKHELLSGYLEVLLMIIGQWAREIVYIDCFAGPWCDDSDDIEGTSIARSIAIMQKARDSLASTGKCVTMRALYIERDDDAYARLQSYLATKRTAIKTHCLKGDFVELRDQILQWAGSRAFAFFFVDPKGYRDVALPHLRSLLERPQSEFLINFMYSFVNMANSDKNREAFSQRLLELFGEIPVVDGLSPTEREDRLLSLYTDRVKDGVGPDARATAVKVLDPTKDRTKYYLVYLTRNPLGIIKFMEQSERCAIVQERVRLDAKLRAKAERTGTGDLFADDEEANPTLSIVQADFQQPLREHWLGWVTTVPRAFTKEDFASMIETTGAYPSQIQMALGSLISEGRIQNLDSRGKRRKNFVHVDKSERLMRIQ